jgi:hypothetical protein
VFPLPWSYLLPFLSEVVADALERLDAIYEADGGTLTEWSPSTYADLTLFWPAATAEWLRNDSYVNSIVQYLATKQVISEFSGITGKLEVYTGLEILTAMAAPDNAYRRERFAGCFGIAAGNMVNRGDDEPWLEDQFPGFASTGPWLPRRPPLLNLAPAGYGRYLDLHKYAGAYIAVGQIIGMAIWITWPRTEEAQRYLNMTRPHIITLQELCDLLRPFPHGRTVGLVMGHKAFVVKPDEYAAVFAVSSVIFATTSFYRAGSVSSLLHINNTVIGIAEQLRGEEREDERRTALDSVLLWRAHFLKHVCPHRDQRTVLDAMKANLRECIDT